MQLMKWSLKWQTNLSSLFFQQANEMEVKPRVSPLHVRLLSFPAAAVGDAQKKSRYTLPETMDTIRNKIYLLHHELTEALFSQKNAETVSEEKVAGREKPSGG